MATRSATKKTATRKAAPKKAAPEKTAGSVPAKAAAASRKPAAAKPGGRAGEENGSNPAGQRTGLAGSRRQTEEGKARCRHSAWRTQPAQATGPRRGGAEIWH